MKLTVAHKVILGFGFIALLLLFASLSSLWSFAVVSESTSKVNDIAVPVQQQSNQAQIELLKLAKLSALGFTADEPKAIEQYQQAVRAMFKDKLQTQQSAAAVTEELKQLIQLIDDAGATLVDITYLETPGKKA